MLSNVGLTRGDLSSFAARYRLGFIYSRYLPQGVTPRLRVSTPSALRAVSMLASEYRRAIPKLTLEVFSLSTRDILHRLKNKEVHLGLAYADGCDPAVFESVVLYSERFVLLSSDRAGLPTKASCSWAEAARFPLCLFNHEMQNRKIVDAAFRQAGVAPNVVVETNTLTVLYEEVRTGEVCSIAPVSALPDYLLASGISIRPIEPQQLSPMSLLRLRQDSSPAVVSAAWEMAPMMDLQGRLDGVLEAATLTRILLGVGILLLLALAVNNVGPRRWPLRWW